MKLTWLGHASFKMEHEDKIIYIDPYAGEQDDYNEKADLILITEASFDHFSRQKVMSLLSDETHVFGPEEVCSQIFGCRTFRPGERVEFEDHTTVMATPAMHHGETPSLGWLIGIGGKKIWITGETENVPDVQADVIITPIGGTHTKSPEMAAGLVKVIKPEVAIPMHYGRIEGTQDDALMFKELVEADRQTRVIILEQGITEEL